MPTPAALVTASEISRLAGVTRATVSNWRRRHADFPAPSGGTDSSPAYDLDAVKAWLAARGQLPASTPLDDLRAVLRGQDAGDTVSDRLFLLLLAATRLDAGAIAELAHQKDEQLAACARRLVRAEASGTPGVVDAAYRKDDAGLLRALLQATAAEGAVKVADVLAEQAGGESTSTGGYDTPAQVAELMAELLVRPDNSYPASAFDPACGAGNLLVAASQRGVSTVYGQDISRMKAAQAAVRVAALAPTSATEVRAGDSLRADGFPELLVDAVLCAPPYGDRNWGHDELAYDPRWVYGLPPRVESELAWVQHCLAHLKPGGQAVVLLTPSTADRSAGRRIRAELIRSGTLRCLVALPPRVAAPLHVGLHLWLLQSPPPGATVPPTVLFVDASDATSDGRPHWATLRRAVIDAWRAFAQAPDDVTLPSGAARAVSAIDLLDDAVDLNPSRLCRALAAPPPPREHAATVTDLRSRLEAATALLGTTAAGISTTPAGTVPVSWRTASVADLVRGGALTLLRAHPPSGVDDEETKAAVTIEPGDVILPELLNGGAPAVRVATEDDDGAQLGRLLYLLRPDPARLDSWFLAGFLGTPENIHSATTGTSVVRVDVRRLRVPLMVLPEQRRYGETFRQLAALRDAAALASRLADDAAQALSAGITTGALLPDAPLTQPTPNASLDSPSPGKAKE